MLDSSLKVVAIGTAMLSALTVSSDGTLVAIPTGDSGPFKNSSKRSSSSERSSSASKAASVDTSVMIPTGIHISRSGVP